MIILLLTHFNIALQLIYLLPHFIYKNWHFQYIPYFIILYWWSVIVSKTKTHGAPVFYNHPMPVPTLHTPTPCYTTPSLATPPPSTSLRGCKVTVKVGPSLLSINSALDSHRLYHKHRVNQFSFCLSMKGAVGRGTPLSWQAETSLIALFVIQHNAL